MKFSWLVEALTGPDTARVPKYLRLSDGISGAVEAGDLVPGERLPGEAELAAMLPASLGTIQKALAHLAERGVIVRRHGSGTFVADGRDQLRDVWHFRFPAEDGATLLPVRTRVHSIGRVGPDGPWAGFFPGETEFLVIERRIAVNGEFDCLGRIFLSAARFAGLVKEPKRRLDNANIRSLLRERFGAPTLRIVEEVGAETMPDDVCGKLDLTRGRVGMVCHIRGYGYRDEPVTYQLVFVPPDTRRLEIRPRTM